MSRAVNAGAGTLDRMATDKNKKPTGGKHTTPRQNIGVPGEWHAVMRQLAAKQKMLVLWYMLDLVAQKADELGVDRPALPWEGEGEE